MYVLRRGSHLIRPTSPLFESSSSPFPSSLTPTGSMKAILTLLLVSTAWLGTTTGGCVGGGVLAVTSKIGTHLMVRCGLSRHRTDFVCRWNMPQAKAIGSQWDGTFPHSSQLEQRSTRWVRVLRCSSCGDAQETTSVRTTLEKHQTDGVNLP